MSLVLRIVAALGAVATGFSASNAKSIRQIDFKNFCYAWDSGARAVPMNWRWLGTSARSCVRLLNGSYRFGKSGESEKEKQQDPSLRLNSITYGDLEGDGAEEAVVNLSYHTGGTANWDYLYVFKLENGAPTLVGRLRSGSRADGGLLKVSIQNGLLVLEFSDPERRVADCCSSGFIRVRYRLEKGSFQESGARERGTLSIEEH